MEQPDLILERSDKQSFAFTLRRTTLKNGQPTKQDYEDHVNKLLIATKSLLSERCFERTGGLHMHGIFEIPKKTQLYKFRYRGWKLHLEEIWDIYGWKRYMSKEQTINFHEAKLEEQEHPAIVLRRSLFRTISTAPADITSGVSASLPDLNHQDSEKVKLCERGNAEGVWDLGPGASAPSHLISPSIV